MVNSPKYIVIHNSAELSTDNPDQFEAINEYHKSGHPDAPFPISSLGFYVGYHRLITGNKNYQCRLDTDEGSHCNQEFNGSSIYPAHGDKALSMNFQSLAICWGGNGDMEYPKDAEYDLLKDQVQKWQDQYGISNENVFFHHYFAPWKTCAGILLDEEWLDNLLLRTSDETADMSCEPEKAVIAEQQDQISGYKKIVNFLSKFIK